MRERPPFPFLETARLHMRELRGTDAEAILSIHGDPVLMKWYGNTVADLQGAQQLIELIRGWQLLPDPGVRWALQVRSDDQLIGTCGLFKWNRSWGHCSLGYELTANAQGQGYMREAVEAALAWGWVHMEGLVRIEARIHPDNKPSQRLIKSVGFEQEGLLRKAGFWNDQHHDFQVWSIVQS